MEIQRVGLDALTCWSQCLMSVSLRKSSGIGFRLASLRFSSTTLLLILRMHARHGGCSPPRGKPVACACGQSSPHACNGFGFRRPRGYIWKARHGPATVRTQEHASCTNGCVPNRKAYGGLWYAEHRRLQPSGQGMLLTMRQDVSNGCSLCMQGWAERCAS